MTYAWILLFKMYMHITFTNVNTTMLMMLFNNEWENVTLIYLNIKQYNAKMNLFHYIIFIWSIKVLMKFQILNKS